MLKKGLWAPPNRVFSKVNSFRKKYDTFFENILGSDMVRKNLEVSTKWSKKSHFFSKSIILVFSQGIRALSEPFKSVFWRFYEAIVDRKMLHN